MARRSNTANVVKISANTLYEKARFWRTALFAHFVDPTTI